MCTVLHTCWHILIVRVCAARQCWVRRQNSVHKRRESLRHHVRACRVHHLWHHCRYGFLSLSLSLSRNDCIIFGIIAGSLSSVAMTETLAQQEIRVQQTRLSEFLRHKRISQQLQTEVTSQMENFFETKAVFDEQEILDRLPPKHRKALLMEMYRSHLQSCPLMRGMEEGIVSAAERLALVVVWLMLCLVDR